MDGQDQRAALKAAIERDGTSLTWLSERLLKRNAAYLQQYLTRGTPRLLAEGDRRLLAKFLRVSDAALGGVEAAGDDSIAVPRYVLAASAGPGALIGEEQRGVPFRFDARFLAGLGVRRDAASLIEVKGDSMQPTLVDGDTILVDHARRSIAPRGGVYAIRLDGMLGVKRLRAIGREVEVVSDNADYATVMRAGDAVEVIGRVVWIGRSLAGL
ncbi:S24 family peptidase [Sphingomonas aestuarii]|jgi:repressor LexA